MHVRILRALTTSLAALLFCGCAGPLRPVFPEVSPPIVWPPPPDIPRIRYLGALFGEASLHRPPTAGESFRAILEGPIAKPRFVSPIAVAVSGARVAVADPSADDGPCVFLLDLESRRFDTLRPDAHDALQWPIDVAWIDDRIVVADAQRGEILILDSAGVVQNRIGKGLLSRPSSIAWDAVARQLLALDAGAHELLVLDESGSLLRKLGGPGNTPGRFNRPTGLAIAPLLSPNTHPLHPSSRPPITHPLTSSTPTPTSPPHTTSFPSPTSPALQTTPPYSPQTDITASQLIRLVIADAMNFRVQTLDPAFEPLTCFGKKGDAAGDFSLPRDVALDAAGNLYVLDNQFENIQVFDPAGRLLMAIGENGGGPGQFNIPSGITIDSNSRIWIADTYNSRVQVFQFLPEPPP